MRNSSKEKTGKMFEYLYSSPLISNIHNWGQKITERYLPNHGYILDLRSGTGEHALFANDVTRYIALDCDRNVLEISREKNRYQNHIQANGECLPFKSYSFDGIISVYNLEHIQKLDQCISECYRVMKPGAHFAIALPTEGYLFRLGRRFFTARQAVRELGFSSIQEYEEYVRTEHINSFSSILVIIQNKFKVSKIRWYPLWIPSSNLNICVALSGIKKGQ